MTGRFAPMKYSLRSLMIVAILAPPLLAVGWGAVSCFIVSRERADTSSGTAEEIDEAIRKYEKYRETHP